MFKGVSVADMEGRQFFRFALRNPHEVWPGIIHESIARSTGIFAMAFEHERNRFARLVVAPPVE